MPGAFAHLTIVDQLTSAAYLVSADLPDTAKASLMDNARFADLGAVSPDYPYLALMDSDQKRWADHMHYDRTGDLIRHMLDAASNLPPVQRDIALPWCLGYTAHVVTDMTIHPVVELKVGPYDGNEDAHRRCEMYQDVYIFRRLSTGGVGAAEHLENGIKRCSISAEDDRINPFVGEVWLSALNTIFPQTVAEIGAPDVNKWHKWFVLSVDKIAEEGNALGFIPIARHVLRGLDLVYPSEDEVNDDAKKTDSFETKTEGFTSSLLTPEGNKSYDEIFDRALENVLSAWEIASRHILNKDSSRSAFFGEWNLDTGRDESGNLVFWSE